MYCAMHVPACEPRVLYETCYAMAWVLRQCFLEPQPEAEARGEPQPQQARQHRPSRKRARPAPSRRSSLLRKRARKERKEGHGHRAERPARPPPPPSFTKEDLQGEDRRIWAVAVSPRARASFQAIRPRPCGTSACSTRREAGLLCSTAFSGFGGLLRRVALCLAGASSGHGGAHGLVEGLGAPGHREARGSGRYGGGCQGGGGSPRRCRPARSSELHDGTTWTPCRSAS